MRRLPLTLAEFNAALNLCRPYGVTVGVNGYWANDINGVGNTGNICSPCDSTCYTCVPPGASTDCTSCTGSRFLEGTECLAVCPNGQYGNYLTHTCEPCDEACTSKLGGGMGHTPFARAPRLALHS